MRAFLQPLQGLVRDHWRPCGIPSLLAILVIAALFVDPHGTYSEVAGCEVWGLPYKDAREYAGPYRVIAHPPCARWCRLAGLVEARWGLKRGDDGGCFASAMASVRRWGGVLEHPAYTDAWAAFGLTAPLSIGWHPAGFGDPGWVCQVEQHHYGHKARKATWLYAVGTALPTLRWGRARRPKYMVSWCDTADPRPRLTKKEASATPVAFRDELIRLVRT